MTLCGVRTASNLNGSPKISPMGAKFQAVTRSTRVRKNQIKSLPVRTSSRSIQCVLSECLLSSWLYLAQCYTGSKPLTFWPLWTILKPLLGIPPAHNVLDIHFNYSCRESNMCYQLWVRPAACCLLYTCRLCLSLTLNNNVTRVL